MPNFGWDYPPGCHSLPWDNEEEDERCAFRRWVDRWLGTGWTFKQHYIIRRGNLREKNGWTYTLSVFWLHNLYLYWHNRKSFNLRLSLLKAGQRCHPDEQEARLVFHVNASSDLTLDRYLHCTLSRCLRPEEAQAANVESDESDFFPPPMKPIWQHKHVFEKWKGHEH